MADKDNDWNIPSSDGEEDSCDAAQSQVGGKWEIPLKVLLLYSEIEKNGFIELKVKECRSSETVKKQELLKENDATKVDTSPETTGSDETVPQNLEKEKWVYKYA